MGLSLDYFLSRAGQVICMQITSMPKSSTKLIIKLCICLMLVTGTISSCSPPYNRYMEEGQLLFDKSDYGKARVSFRKAVVEARKSSKKKTDQIEAMLKDADCSSQLKESDEQMKTLEKAAELCEKESSLGPKRGGDIRKIMGDSAASRDDQGEAFSNYKKALADYSQGAAEKSAEAGKVYIALGDMQFGKKNWKQAGTYYETGVELLQEANEPRGYIELGRSMHKLAAAYRELNMDNEANELDELAEKSQLGGTKGQIRKMLSGI